MQSAYDAFQEGNRLLASQNPHAAVIPLGRTGSAEEAARGVYFLCSRLSDYVHGQVLAVSGGLQFGMAA